ncbi:tRNA (guanine(10)-N(2))-dimethyltransferase [Nanoarchaeota archaeon]
MVYLTITEGKATILVPKSEKISKKMGVFYNPIMKSNRDITIALLNQFPKMRILDGLAASGVRSIRILKETKHKEVVANDISRDSFLLMKSNFRKNKVKAEIKNQDINILLRESKGFDYIDLDVFGSPNFALDSSIVRLSRGGILAVTATDTSALAGTHPKACLRKYWALPLHNELMHEMGLRILIRKIQLIGAQYEKALTPILAYYKDHYFRIFLRCEKGKKAVDKMLKNAEFLWYNSKSMERGIGIKENMSISGPLWLGPLLDQKVCKNIDEDLVKMLLDEDKIPGIGFYDIHKICKTYKLKIPKFEDLTNKIKKSKYKVARTHFSLTGIKTNIPIKELTKLIRSLA